MTTNVFFDESKEQSKVKSTLVSKYFKAWAMVIVGTMKRPGYRGSNRIAYLDLFAGPGRYKDGTKSTPLMVLETAIQEPDLRDKLVCIFNDKDKDNTQDLQKAIEELPGIETMKYAASGFSVGTPKILWCGVHRASGRGLISRPPQWK